MCFPRLKRWLSEIKQSCDGIDCLHFEEVCRHISTNVTHVCGGFLATLTARREHHQILYQDVPVGTIKKHATGKGNAGKENIIAPVTVRGYAPVDDNEADALALLYWTIQHHDDGQEV